MSLSKLTQSLDIIQGLPDQPTLTAQQLKAKFDEAVNIIKNYLNNTLTSEIDTNFSDIDAGDIKYDDSETSLSATNIQDAIEALYTLIDGLSFTAQAIAYSKNISGTSVTNVKDALDKLVSNDSSKDTTIGKKTTYDDFVITEHSSGTLDNGNGGYATKIINISKSGYRPIAIAGFDSSSTNHYNNTPMGACLVKLRLVNPTNRRRANRRYNICC